MAWWLVGLTLCVLVALALLLAPVAVSLSVQARGEPDGTFAVAGGARLGPVVLTCLMLPEVPTCIEVRLFGMLMRARREPVLTGKARPGRFSKLDPIDAIVFLAGERRRVALEWLEIELSYSFANVALTGQLLAAMCSLSALLPPRVALRQIPSWELVNRAALSVDGRCRLWPGRIAIDCLRFMRQSRMLQGSGSADPQQNRPKSARPPAESNRA